MVVSKAKKYPLPDLVSHNCGNCHLVPRPTSLSQEVWVNSILPRMSAYFKWSGSSNKFPYANRAFYNQSGVLPMNDQIWSDILDYYAKYGLDTIIRRPTSTLPIQSYFKETAVDFSPLLPMTTAIGHTSDGRIVVAHHREISYLTNTFEINKTVSVHSEVTQLLTDPGSHDLWILESGKLDPHEGAYGRLIQYSIAQDEQIILVDQLKRPVFIYPKDEEVYISEFGFITGRLSKHSLGNKEQAAVIHSLPGTYKISEAQLSRDQPKELVFSISQAQEGVYRMNKEHALDPLLRFPPEFGLSDLDIDDLDGDGLDDLLITNGDNADYSIVPKAYHGVRIYRNSGDGAFELSFFYPLYGATQARTIDADGRNQKDIIVSCFFSEYAEERIILLIHTGIGAEYDAYRFEQSTYGKWMVMHTADVNSDGKADVMLGSYTGGPMTGQVENSAKKVDLLILLNKN